MYRPLVGHHVAELFEPHWTVRTRTSQLAIVPGLDVPLKSLLSCVIPRTLSTLKRLLDVCLRMKHEALFHPEFLAAGRALERLVQMSPRVVLRDGRNNVSNKFGNFIEYDPDVDQKYRAYGTHLVCVWVQAEYCVPRNVWHNFAVYVVLCRLLS